MSANFNANVDNAPRFRIEEPSPSLPRRSVETALRLTLLLAIASILLLATAALRSWTAANDATLPPFEFAAPKRQPTVPPSWHEERDRFAFPSLPRI
jgi:hypothetical protein